eukprot:6096469-Pleurochrysis_carterae.AAC.2
MKRFFGLLAWVVSKNTRARATVRAQPHARCHICACARAHAVSRNARCMGVPEWRLRQADHLWRASCKEL